MELGCGTGAVIRECYRRALARRYIGVDYSAEAIAYLQTNAPQIEAIRADITSPDFLIPEVDVVYLRHVIEHLDDSHAFPERYGARAAVQVHDR
jgi:SAM-dependent methyltransferase